jgi:nucleotide-binding universal stress UspA family protein
MYERILVTTDGSALSKKAVASAIELAAITGAELIAVRVIHRNTQSYFDGSINIDPNESARIEAHWADEAQKTVDAVRKLGEAKSVKVKALVVKSNVISEAIIAAAKKNKADLIVMASHGRRGIKRVLLGSETQNVLTHSEIPVLVLR